MRNFKWQGLAAAIVALSVTVTGAVAAGGGKGNGANGAYIVQLADMPVSAYRGDIVGYKATKPRKGQKIDPDSPRCHRLHGYLDARHDAVARERRRRQEALRLWLLVQRLRRRTDGGAGRRAGRRPACSSVEQGRPLHDRHRLRRPPSSASAAPTASGLRRAPKARTSSSASSTAASGRSIRAFRDRTGTNGNATKDGKLGYQQIPGWHGKCTPGEQFSALELQPEADRRPLLQRRLGRRRRHRRAAARGSSSRRATTTATARTRHRPPAATTASRHDGPAAVVRHRSAAWRRVHASPRTRSAGQRRTRARRAASAPTSSPRSTRPSPTAST